MADYERVLCVKNEVFVFKIPPRPSNRGYRAADWDLQNPQWTGRLRVVSRDKRLFIKLEEKSSGDLFAQCPVETYPSVAVESVMDSSRYFVLRLMDENGRTAFIGIGFSDRGDSFDLNVSLQDHFKQLKQEDELVKATKELESAPKLDLGFKEGQTIKINIGNKKSDRPKGKSSSGGGIGLIAPPPGSGSGGIKISPQGGAIAPQQQQSTVQPQNTQSNAGNLDLFNDFISPAPAPAPVQSTAASSSVAQAQLQSAGNDPWGDFTSAGSNSSSGNTDNNWIQF